MKDKTTKDTIRVTIDLPPDLFTWLSTEVAERRTSKQEYIENIIGELKQGKVMMDNSPLLKAVAEYKKCKAE